jgi:hypothetical protein
LTRGELIDAPRIAPKPVVLTHPFFAHSKFITRVLGMITAKASAEADAIMSTGFSTLAAGDKNSLNRRFV